MPCCQGYLLLAASPARSRPLYSTCAPRGAARLPSSATVATPRQQPSSSRAGKSRAEKCVALNTAELSSTCTQGRACVSLLRSEAWCPAFFKQQALIHATGCPCVCHFGLNRCSPYLADLERQQQLTAPALGIALLREGRMKPRYSSSSPTGASSVARAVRAISAEMLPPSSRLLACAAGPSSH